ncbi:MAG TPA: hypothetical protein VMP03_08500 [Methylomirabilota bacterium]|nr:hypothetical protein [Methylomirabilota bacterium]
MDKKTLDGQLPVRLCNYTDVYYNERIHDGMQFMQATAAPEQVRRFSLRAGDVLLTKDSETADDIGVSAYVPETMPDVLCGYHLAVARPGPLIDGRFLRWALASTVARSQLEVAATGVTRFGLREEGVGSVLLPVPTLGAQRAIADYLDSETARIDRAIASVRLAYDLLAERLAAAIESIVWREGEPVIPLMRLAQDDRQIQYGIVLPGPDVDDGVPIVKGGDLLTGKLKAAGLAKTTRDIESAYARSRLRADDTAFAIRGAVGACALVPKEVEGANITQDVAMIAPRADVDPSWLLYVLRSPRFQGQAEARILGATIRGINIRDLKRLKVPMIALASQRAQARQIQRLQLEFDSLALARARQAELLLERRQALITDAVTAQVQVAGVAA